MKLLAKIIYFIRSLFVKTEAQQLTKEYGKQLDNVRIRKQTPKERRDNWLAKKGGYINGNKVYK